MTEAVTRDMASSDWLKLGAPFAPVLGQDRKVIDQHSYLIHQLCII